MVEILDRQLLAEGIWQTKVLAPRIAKSAKPGQFIIVRADEKGERIPLTIADYDIEAGSVTMVTQALGVSTRKIVAKEVGKCFADVAGPLGRPSDFVAEPLEELRNKRFVFIGGGQKTSPSECNVIGAQLNTVAPVGLFQNDFHNASFFSFLFFCFSWHTICFCKWFENFCISFH